MAWCLVKHRDNFTLLQGLIPEAIPTNVGPVVTGYGHTSIWEVAWCGSYLWFIGLFVYWKKDYSL